MMDPKDGLPQCGYGWLKEMIRLVSQSSGQVEWNPS